MRIKSITKASVDGNDAKIDFVHSNNSSDAMFMSPDVAAGLMAGLSDIGHRLKRDRSGFQNAPAYEIVRCQAVALENQQNGIALTVREGFDLVFLLPSPVLSALRGCIEHIESGNPYDGSKH